ncbi:hypothetical protein CSR02_03910 [Acetobacter pomorum]|uniref:Uncharacterized protein n=1 Tax=Acetobacter pomorum TaxID=65959 RepID=A0A2G4RGM9_9PROT|nr:hypothetical protein CSR02_03910 [Acetobacter pomorum]
MRDFLPAELFAVISLHVLFYYDQWETLKKTARLPYAWGKLHFLIRGEWCGKAAGHGQKHRSNGGSKNKAPHA